MKTSPSQFELLVTFMEQHGDLNKPSCNARGRMEAIKHWHELTAMLNSDGSGDVKTSEKWKKVWSDFKNNTKKKAAHLHRAAHGTGGGPAIFSKLSYLEQRVLNIIGVQVATGLLVEEAGLYIYSQQGGVSIQTIVEADVQTSTQIQLVEYPEEQVQTIASPLQPSPSIPICPRPPTSEMVHILDTQPWDEPVQSTSHHVTPPLTGPAESPDEVTVIVQAESHSPTRFLSPTLVTQAAQLGPTTPSREGQTTPQPIGHIRPRRSIRTRLRGSPQRPPRRTHTELAAEQFLNAEEQWRNLTSEQQRNHMELKREQNRLREMEIKVREMEVQAQRGWQAMGTRALDLIEKIVNKYV